MSTVGGAFSLRKAVVAISDKLIELLECIQKKWTQGKSFRSLTLPYDVGIIEQRAQIEHPVKAFGWAARDKSGVLAPFKFSRRATGDYDVTLKVLYCGVSHTDLHYIKNEWGLSHYPLVPGHEIVGVVMEVGAKVNKFNVGDKVGVGSLVNACRQCPACNNDLENFCRNLIPTYNGEYHGTRMYGGFSNIMVVNQDFVIRWPDGLPLDSGAPLLVAGIAVYSPLKYCNLNSPGMHIGVVGLGGLGHLAVKFAKAFGAEVTVISTNPSKKTYAFEYLGADHFLVSSDEKKMADAAETMDGILDTACETHPLKPLIDMLKYHGVIVMLGAPSKPFELPVLPMLLRRKFIAGSSIGGLKETQEMIDFAANNNITADVEVISIDYINTAMARLAKGEPRYRYVIDIANTLKEA